MGLSSVCSFGLRLTGVLGCRHCSDRRPDRRGGRWGCEGYRHNLIGAQGVGFAQRFERVVGRAWPRLMVVVTAPRRQWPPSR